MNNWYMFFEDVRDMALVIIQMILLVGAIIVVCILIALGLVKTMQWIDKEERVPTERVHAIEQRMDSLQSCIEFYESKTNQ